ncbi:hypothetical protein PLIIFM63780_003597 [Purpureocillium lilacinum]|uniref:uncharacterized protein n=1 Tax=Purpureocillium lilacinum TaxID=33203 RepID=UPI002084B50F|nr:hypothetical protein PLICBS_000144 [Purpureocillium lilacinum]GJN80073.1 hypothetical protein PLIIFM63780_003597 [Purpureocillium lilacinum]
MSTTAPDDAPPPAYAEKPGDVRPVDEKAEQHVEPLVAQPAQGNVPGIAARLEVDFTLHKMMAQIKKAGESAGSVYTVDYKTLTSPHLIFTETATGTRIGSGTLHPISINAGYEVRGEKGKLKALRRMHTEYTHLSRAYSQTGDLVAMTWGSEADFTTWDFICKGPDGVPVARFASNCWARKKVGAIEFYGARGLSKEAQEEILVTGLTLYSCMILRTSSILSFFGGIFSKPGPLPNPESGSGKT